MNKPLYSKELICFNCVHRYKRKTYEAQHSWCKKVERQTLPLVWCPIHKEDKR